MGVVAGSIPAPGTMNTRLAHELACGRKLWRPKPGGTSAADRELIAPGAIPAQAFVTADEVAAWYWAHERTDWSCQSDNNPYGSCRPPFDSMWIEFRYPPRENRVGDDSRRELDVTRCGYLVTAEGLDAVSFLGIIEYRGRGLACIPYMSRYGLDDNGVPISFGMAPLGPYWERELVGRGDIHEAMGPHEALLALSMMNCVNANIRTETASKQDRAALKKRGLIPYEMKTIHIPGGRGTTRRTLAQASGGPQPLHLVRGHFKTYTEEAPLFGKRTGTYWWGWQSRGKREHGVRDHTYEVGVQ